MITINCNNVNDTDKLALLISKFVFSGFLILASGDLGAGKTKLAKCIAGYLGVKDNVTSPTFNILKCYRGDIYEFYHIDAYRLEGIKQDLGLEEYIEGDGVCYIEWSEYLAHILPEEYLEITISIIDENRRKIDIKGVGNKYIEIEKEINKLW